MGEIVNLRRVKKQRARRDAAQDARENRARHGRTAAQKANDARAEDRRRMLLEATLLDGARQAPDRD